MYILTKMFILDAINRNESFDSTNIYVCIYIYTIYVVYILVWNNHNCGVFKIMFIKAAII